LAEDAVAAELFSKRLTFRRAASGDDDPAPSATNTSAVRRPMPLVAPVMTAILPLSRPMPSSS
jgi:hypothetical protein